jgi:hypothetical protein
LEKERKGAITEESERAREIERGKGGWGYKRSFYSKPGSYLAVGQSLEEMLTSTDFPITPRKRKEPEKDLHLKSDKLRGCVICLLVPDSSISKLIVFFFFLFVCFLFCFGGLFVCLFVLPLGLWHHELVPCPNHSMLF